MKRKSKLLIFAVPMIVVLAFFMIYEYGIVNLYRETEALREDDNAKMKTLAKYTALIAQQPSLQKQMVELRQARKDEETKMMAGQTTAIASANLQNAVKEIITARNGIINSERTEQAADEGKFKVISVSTDVVFPDIRALSDTLAAIETQIPYLVVREVDIRVRNYADPRDLVVKLKVAALAGP